MVKHGHAMCPPRWVDSNCPSRWVGGNCPLRWARWVDSSCPSRWVGGNCPLRWARWVDSSCPSRWVGGGAWSFLPFIYSFMGFHQRDENKNAELIPLHHAYNHNRLEFESRPSQPASKKKEKEP